MQILQIMNGYILIFQIFDRSIVVAVEVLRAIELVCVIRAILKHQILLVGSQHPETPHMEVKYSEQVFYSSPSNASGWHRDQQITICW